MSSRRRYAPHSFCTNEGPAMMSVIMGLAVKSFMGSVMKLVMVSVISSLESLFVSKFQNGNKVVGVELPGQLKTKRPH